MEEITRKVRDDCPSGYYYASNDKKTWSVVDIGTMMSTHPTIENLRKAGLFLGWEAFEIVNDDLDTNRQFRAN